jgi:Putative polyhydroxyalkanoic acid system protein (PHA_gran_rgn)
VKHSVPHDLSIDLAKKATGKALESYQERFAEFQPQVSWLDERTATISFKAKGMSLGANLAVTEQAIVVDMDVPFLLKFMEKQAVEVIDKQVTKWIDRAKKGLLK